MGDKKYITFVKASVFKRLSSFLCDALLIFIVTILFVNISGYIVKNTSSYKQGEIRFNELAIQSNLYEEKNGKVVLISDNYDENLDLFYQDYDKKNHLTNSYNDKKSNYQSLFEYNENTGKYDEIGTEEEILDFYKKTLYEASSLFLSEKETTKANYSMSLPILISVLISFLIPVIIFLLIVPLILKNGQTIGKKFIGLKYVSTKSDGNKVTNGMFSVNFLIFFLFVILLSIPLFLLPMLINAIFIIFNKNGNSLADYYTNFILVDNNKFFSSSQVVKEVTIEKIGNYSEDN